jgi:hypothetical protein
MEVPMRNFVAASCCLIVGLEVLVGVPLAVCLGFLCFGSGFSETYVTEVPGPAPIYGTPAYMPPPLPQPLAPAGSAGPATFDPYAPAPKVTVCPAPTACPMPTMTLPLPAGPSSLADASGSYAQPYAAAVPSENPANEPLAELPAVVASEPPATDAADAGPDVSAGLPQLADVTVPVVQLTVNDDHQLLARVCTTGECAAAPSDCEPSASQALVASIGETVRLLYKQAERHEAASEFTEADRLRALARELRLETGRLSRRTQEVPLLSEAPYSVLPSGVTVGPPPRG